MQTLTYTIEYVPWWIGLVFGLLVAVVLLSAGTYSLVEYNKRTGKKFNTYSLTLAGLLVAFMFPFFSAMIAPAFLGNVASATESHELKVSTLKAGQLEALDSVGASESVTLGNELLLVCDTDGRCSAFPSTTEVEEIVDHFKAFQLGDSNKTVIGVKY